MTRRKAFAMRRLRQLFFLLLWGTALGSLGLPGCKPREEQLTTSGGLEFSADTVKFDTVFTTLRTITKRLWVYNRHPRAVTIDLVSLDNPSTSPYTLIINGDKQQTATGLLVRGQDSLLVLVQAKLPDNGQNTAAKDFVVQESLNFSTNGQQQRVLLRSFGQNIYLHQNAKLACDAVWTNDRPHVLYGTVEVPLGCTLRIKPGTRIYGHTKAALVVRGTLLVNDPRDFAPGAADTDTISAQNAAIVHFSGDRSVDRQYTTAPGQWLGILFDASSRGNVLRYAVVQNATYGALLFNPRNQTPRPNLTVQNAVIRYISAGNDTLGIGAALPLPVPVKMASAGILSVAGDVQLENTLFNDCYQYALCGYGGEYALNFCTIANNAATVGIRQTPSLYVANTAPGSSQAPLPTSLSVRNSIVYGNTDNELTLENYDAYKSGVSIQNSLLKTSQYAAATDAPGKPGLAAPTLGNVLNQDPKFRQAFSSTRADYRLRSDSPARQRPNPAAPLLARDLLNLPRTATPSLGAYESLK